MRHFLLLCVVFTSSFCISQIKVNEQFDATPLSEVLKKFEDKYNVKLAYDPDLIKDFKITDNIENLDPDEALSKVLENTSLSFDKVKKNYFAIRPSYVNWAFETVFQDKYGEPIPYVKVRIVGTYKGTYGDENGLVNFSHNSDKAPMLEISSLGFEKMTISVDKIQSGQPMKLRQDILEFPEVVVEYLTEGISQSHDVSKIVIRPKKIGAVPGTTEPDVFQMVQNVPGINSASSTVSEIQIRGGTADQNNLIWDGIPIYHPGHFNGMISSINPNIIDRTELFRGVYDPYFGGKASGLINLKSIDYIPEKVNYGGGVNMIQADAYVSAPIKDKVAILVSGRRSYMDLWRSPTYQAYANRVYQETEIQNDGVITEEPGFLGDPGEVLEGISNTFFYYDLNGKVVYKPSYKSLLTVSGLYTTNRLNYSSSYLADNETQSNLISSTNLGTSVHFNQQLSDKWSIDLLGSFAQYQYNFEHIFFYSEEDSITVERALRRSNSVGHYSIKFNNSFTLGDYHLLTAGYQLHYSDVEYSISSNEDGNDISEVGYNSTFAHVVNVNYQFKRNRFLSKVGGRVSFLTETGYILPEPRVYAQYKINEWLTAKGAFGMQSQYISQVEQFEYASLGLSNRIWVMADEEEEIPVVKSTLFNAGFVFRYKGWHLEIEGYMKQLTDIVNFSNDPNLSSGLVRGDANAMGIDVMVKKLWKNYRSWISYSLANVEYQFPDLATSSFPAPFEQLHTVKWVNTLSWRQFEFSTAFKIASGQPYSPINGVTTTGNTDPEADLEDLFEIDYGNLNSATLPLFHQLDLTVFYTFPKNPDKNWKGRVGVSCFNVYNQTNILSRNYQLDVVEDEFGTESIETYAIDRYYLKFTPNAVVRFDF